MKWYNYTETDFINLESCENIFFDNSYEQGKTRPAIVFLTKRQRITNSYDTEEERDAEFAKIKILMSVDERNYTSRCC